MSNSCVLFCTEKNAHELHIFICFKLHYIEVPKKKKPR